jgi:hypothetical protein
MRIAANFKEAGFLMLSKFYGQDLLQASIAKISCQQRWARFLAKKYLAIEACNKS